MTLTGDATAMRDAFGPIVQIGYLVDDLDAAVARWTGRLGVGPWTVFRNVTLDGRYRGEATVVGMHVALGYRDGLQIELIEVTNHAPSPYRGADGHRLKGIHHVAWLVDDRDAAVAAMTARGLTLAFEAGNPGTKVAYLESPDEPGVLFEYIESPATRTLIAEGVAATRDWDGSNPVTVIDFAAPGSG